MATLRGHLVDPDQQDELFLSVDWGDGTPTEAHAVGRAPFAFEHRYVDDAPSGTAAATSATVNRAKSASSSGVHRRSVSRPIRLRMTET